MLVTVLNTWCKRGASTLGRRNTHFGIPIALKFLSFLQRYERGQKGRITIFIITSSISLLNLGSRNLEPKFRQKHAMSCSFLENDLEWNK